MGDLAGMVEDTVPRVEERSHRPNYKVSQGPRGTELKRQKLYSESSQQWKGARDKRLYRAGST